MTTNVVIFPLRGANSSPPNPLAGFEGPLCGRQRGEKGRKGPENERKGRKGMEGGRKYAQNKVLVTVSSIDNAGAYSGCLGSCSGTRATFRTFLLRAASFG